MLQKLPRHHIFGHLQPIHTLRQLVYLVECCLPRLGLVGCDDIHQRSACIVIPLVQPGIELDKDEVFLRLFPRSGGLRSDAWISLIMEDLPAPPRTRNPNGNRTSIGLVHDLSNGVGNPREIEDISVCFVFDPHHAPPWPLSACSHGNASIVTDPMSVEATGDSLYLAD
jgi:hypothetical protein